MNNSTECILVEPSVSSPTVVVKSPSDSRLVFWLLRYLGEPITSATDMAVKGIDAFRQPAGVHETAPENEADRQIGRLNAMRGAGDGWAGPGSHAPNEKSLDAAISLIRRIQYFPVPLPMASIGSHGNAGLFWSDPKLYADVELLEDGRVGYLLQVSGAETVDDEEEVPEIGLPSGIATALASAYLANVR